MTTIDLTLLETHTLSSGSHEDRADGVCALELVAWMAGEPHTDSPACTCQVIAAFGRSWNDCLPSDAERDRILKPLLPLMIGTRTTVADEETRAWLAVDWLARVCTPAWLRLAGLTEEARLLESTARIVDAVTCDAAVPALAGAASAARDARDASAAWAAWAASAARDAWDASAAWAARAASAAWDASAASAASAAWAARDASAARAARAASAASAAWDASAARDASAAWAARDARDASAAWAARDALRPTVAALQDSASELVRTMCAVGRPARAA